MVNNAIRHLGLLAYYGDYTMKMVYVFDYTRLTGALWTPPIWNFDTPLPAFSLAMQYAVNHTVQYGAIYLVLFVIIVDAPHQFDNFEFLMSVIAISDSSQKTVTFVSMLEILIDNTRVRALQLAGVTDETVADDKEAPDYMQAILTADAKLLTCFEEQCAVIDKIKVMIEKMIFRLMKEQKDKDEHKLGETWRRRRSPSSGTTRPARRSCSRQKLWRRTPPSSFQ